MKDYNAEIEVAAKIRGPEDDELVDRVMDALEPYHAAIGMSPRGYAFAIITLPANDLRQAATTALALISTAFGGAELVAARVMTTEEFDRREEWAEVPPLVSVTEAAELLGVSRTRVQQRINDKSIQAVKVGEGYAIVKSTLNSRPPGRPKKRATAKTGA